MSDRMAPEKKKIMACIAYSIRLTKRANYSETVEQLWSAMYSLKIREPSSSASTHRPADLMVGSRDVRGGQIISLAQSLGIEVHDGTPSSGCDVSTQTSSILYTEDECKSIAERVTEETQAALRMVEEQLDHLQRSLSGLQRSSTESTSALEAVTSAALLAHLTEPWLALRSSTGSMQSSDDSLRTPAKPPDCALTYLKDERLAEKQAFREKRRRERRETPST